MTDSHEECGLAAIMGRQLALQRESFGIDPMALEGEELTRFIRWNVLALEDELHEALAETHWKPWATGEGFLDRDAFVKELIDAQHFLNNLYLAAGVSSNEVVERYLAKAKVNADRQEAGYSSTSGKCEHCGRATDEPG